jgi:glycosyltransferase involved in cell wall biosynthesis
MKLVLHEKNSGKGAAVATGVEHARGDVTVIQDADLEYNPRDLVRSSCRSSRTRPMPVFGSRFLTGDYRRVLYFRHTLGNRV